MDLKASASHVEPYGMSGEDMTAPTWVWDAHPALHDVATPYESDAQSVSRQSCRILYVR